MKTKHFIGIDFGTSNSYFCITPENVLKPNPICFDDETSIETAVLWDGDTVKDFGTAAVKGWSYAAPEEKKNWRLSLQFKPDISLSERARKDAAAFLKAAFDDIKSRNIIPLGKDARELPIIIGIPAKTLDGHTQAMREILAEAKINNAKLVEEPVGALIHHIMRDDILPEDVSRGILVIDFGGGTCDVAFMLRLEVKHKFGDPILGGRLFDDLFFQWFLEQNPEIENTLSTSEKNFLHRVKCREMKENFSNTMRKNINETFRFYLDSFGKFDNATWDEFIKRAENYSPSSFFFSEIKNYGAAYEELLTQKPIDLIARFRSAVESAALSGEIGKKDVERVVLTGGSSAWPFVKQIVAEIFLLDEKKILQSANPRAAIGEGLALLPGIQEKFNNIINRLNNELEQKVEEITNLVMDDIKNFCKNISNEFVEKIFADAVIPAVNDFLKTGGKFEKLNAAIRAKVDDLKPYLNELVNSRKSEIEAKVGSRIINTLYRWFSENGINWQKDKNIHLSQIDKPDIPISEIKVPLELELAVSGIIGMITGSLLGGAGIALLMQGPIGWLIGFIIGSAGSFFGFQKITDKIPVPRFITNSKITEKSMDLIINRAEKNSKTEIYNHLLEQFDENREAIKKHISDFIHEQIRALDTINSI